MNHYKHLFLDLDNTLLDFTANARETFGEIFDQLQLHDQLNLDEFLHVFDKKNELFWAEYRKGRMKKNELRNRRFKETFSELGLSDDTLSERIGTLYMNTMPTKTNLFEGVHEILDYLEEKYGLYLITNGFADTQLKKLESCKLAGRFRKLFIAELIGYQKPDKRIFEYAVKSIHAHKKECLMIGDDPVADMEGARNAGIDQMFFNVRAMSLPFRPTYEITRIKDIRTLL